MGFFFCAKLLRAEINDFSFLSMRKNLTGSFSLAGVLIAASLVVFDAQVAMACSSGGSSGSGFQHGSSLGSGSVTVCVGSSGTRAGSSTTQTITKTVTVKVPVKPPPKNTAKPPPKPAAKPVAKVLAKPAPVIAKPSCPSASVMASMPRSADAAERWIQSICPSVAKPLAAPKPSVKPIPKPAPKVTPKVTAKTKYKTKKVTETIVIETPGYFYSNSDAVSFYPNSLRALVTPTKVLGIGQLASFSSNPTAHYGISSVLGRQAQVHFVPVESGWVFSDGVSERGADTSRSFSAAGEYQVMAWANYQVSYRLVGETNWQPVAGLLGVESNVLEIKVGASNLKADQLSQGLLLVGSDCSFKPGAFGCDI